MSSQPLRLDQEVVSVSSGSARSVVEVSHAPPAMTIAYSQQRRTASKSTRRKPSTKRKKKFGSGSDIEHLDTVVHVPKRPKSTSHTPVSSLRARPLVSKENLSGAHEMRVLQCSHKKARLPSSISSAANVIPSSQSDELEMVLPGVIKKDPGETEDSVNEWRKSTLNSPGASLMSGHDTAANANMNVDVPVSSPLSEPESLNIASRPDTPERRPNLPAALDVESKTAQIIAQIKADAYAAACSSPEPVTSEFKSLDEDSGDEDDLNLFLIKPENHNRFSSALSSPNDVHPVTRYNLRRKAPPSSPSTSTTLTSDAGRGSHSKRHAGVTRANKRWRSVTGGKSEKKAKLARDDPLDMLLKERKVADKRGKGMEALFHAESTMGGKTDMRAEIDEAWTDEKAAMMAVYEGSRLESTFASPEVNGGDLTFDERERERLLGSKGGKAVTSILKGDQKEVTGQCKVGIALWDVTRVPGVDRTPTAIFSGSRTHRIFGLLHKAVERGDVAQASLLLDSGIAAVIEPAESAGVVLGLCDLALSVPDTDLGESAFQALLHLWRNGNRAAVTIPLPLILATLGRLGAKREVCVGMEWVVGAQTGGVDAGTRAKIVYRLVCLLTASARAGGIKTDDVPDVVMLLLLVGSDPSTSLATEIDVTTAIDVIYGALGPGSDIMAAEAAAFAKLFGFAAALAPANKARLFAFLAGSHPRTRRTARCLAHRLLAAAHTRCSVQDNYAHLPPLTDLYDLLSPSVGPFAIHESTDYEHMCSYVDILAVALSDIDDYVAQERREPPANPLDIIRAAIDAVHARIVDTRAAHLDRSRTKAALHRLSMRIYYQRLATSNSNHGSGKPRNLRDHWIAR